MYINLIISSNMKFADIPYHEHAKERLRSMIDSDRIPHALLIEGPAGIGKFALARAAAQYTIVKTAAEVTVAECARHACSISHSTTSIPISHSLS